MNLKDFSNPFQKFFQKIKPLYLIFFALAIGISLIFNFAFLSKKDSGRQNYQNNTQYYFDEYANEQFLSQVSGDSLSLHFFLASPEKVGIKNQKQTFGSYTYDSMTSSQQYYIDEINALKEFNYNELLPNQQITYDLLMQYYKNQLDFSDLCLCSQVLSPTTGLQAQLPVLLSEYKFYTEGDIKNYLELLSQLGNYFSQICAFQTQKAQKDSFISDFSVDKIVAQCEDFLNHRNTEENLLYTSFQQRLKDIRGLSEHDKEQYIAQNKNLIESQVYPAYQKVIDTLTELKNKNYCKNQNGLYYLKNGQDYYEYLVKNTTGSSKSVLELKGEIQTKIASDMRSLYSLLTVNPELEDQIYAQTENKLKPEQMISDIQKKYSSDFPELKDISYDIKYVNKSLEEHLSPAFYLSPPIDVPNENVIYINGGSKSESQDLYTTLAHEGIPGHMYQANYFANTQPLPIRQLISYGGYTEGWATYVEFMSYHYKYSNEQLAQALSCSASYSLALYSLCDIGVNYEGWTLQNTIDFLKNYSIEDESVCQNIFQAVVEEPGNYLQYYVGYLEILSLKDYVQKETGTSFNLKKFHKALLSLGPADFDTIKKWILYEYQK